MGLLDFCGLLATYCLQTTKPGRTLIRVNNNVHS